MHELTAIESGARRSSSTSQNMAPAQAPLSPSQAFMQQRPPPEASVICRDWIESGSQAERHALEISSQITANANTTKIDLRKTAVLSAAIAKTEVAQTTVNAAMKAAVQFRLLFAFPVLSALIGATTFIRTPFALLHGRIFISCLCVALIVFIVAFTHRNYCLLQTFHSQLSDKKKESIATMNSTVLANGFSQSPTRPVNNQTTAPSKLSRYWLVEVLGPSATATLMLTVLISIVAHGGLVLATFGYFVMPVITETPGLSSLIEGASGINERKMDMILRIMGCSILLATVSLLSRMRIKATRLTTVAITVTITFALLTLWSLSVAHMDKSPAEGQVVTDEMQRTGFKNWTHGESKFSLMESIQYAMAAWFSIEFFPALALTFQPKQSTQDDPSSTSMYLPRSPIYKTLVVLLLITYLVIQATYMALLSTASPLLHIEVALDSSVAENTLLQLLLGPHNLGDGSANDLLIVLLTVIGFFSLAMCLIRTHVTATALLSAIANDYSHSIPSLQKLTRGHISHQRAQLIVSMGMLWILLIGEYRAILVVTSCVSLACYSMFNLQAYFAIRGSKWLKRHQQLKAVRLTMGFGNRCGNVLIVMRGMISPQKTALTCAILCHALVLCICPIAAVVMPIHFAVLYRYLKNSSSASVQFEDSAVDTIRIDWLRKLIKRLQPSSIGAWRPSAMCLPNVNLYNGDTVVMKDPDLMAVMKSLQHSVHVSFVATATNPESRDCNMETFSQEINDALKSTMRHFGLATNNSLMMIRERIRLAEFAGFMAFGGLRSSIVLASYPVYNNQIDLECAASFLEDLQQDCYAYKQSLVLVRSNDTLCPITLSSPMSPKSKKTAKTKIPMFIHSSTLDIWWWSGRTPLPLYIANLMMQSPQFSGCKVRVFACIDSRVTKEEHDHISANLKSSLTEFGMAFIHEVTVLPVDHMPLFYDGSNEEDENFGGVDFDLNIPFEKESSDRVVQSVALDVLEIEQENDYQQPPGSENNDPMMMDFFCQPKEDHYGEQLALPPCIPHYEFPDEPSAVRPPSKSNVALTKNGIASQTKLAYTSSSSELSDVSSATSTRVQKNTEKTSLLTNMPWPFYRRNLQQGMAPTSEHFRMAAMKMNELLQHYSASSTMTITVVPSRPDHLEPTAYVRFIDTLMANINRGMTVFETCIPE